MIVISAISVPIKYVLISDWHYPVIGTGEFECRFLRKNSGFSKPAMTNAGSQKPATKPALDCRFSKTGNSGFPSSHRVPCVSIVLLPQIRPWRSINVVVSGYSTCPVCTYSRWFLGSWALSFGILQGVFKSSERNEQKSRSLSRLYSAISVCYDKDRSSNHGNPYAKLDERRQPKHFSHDIAYFVSYGRWKRGAMWLCGLFHLMGEKAKYDNGYNFFTTYVAPTMRMIAGLFESSNPWLWNRTRILMGWRRAWAAWVAGSGMVWAKFVTCFEAIWSFASNKLRITCHCTTCWLTTSITQMHRVITNTSVDSYRNNSAGFWQTGIAGYIAGSRLLPVIVPVLNWTPVLENRRSRMPVFINECRFLKTGDRKCRFESRSNIIEDRNMSIFNRSITD